MRTRKWSSASRVAARSSERSPASAGLCPIWRTTGRTTVLGICRSTSQSLTMRSSALGGAPRERDRLPGAGADNRISARRRTFLGIPELGAGAAGPGLPRDLAGRGGRREWRGTIFVDTDAGLVQVWMTTGDIQLAAHDSYFTIGETVGTPLARFPDCGLRWHYTPTPVFLGAWPVVEAGADAPYTTVTHRWGGTFEFEGEQFSNDKSAAFLEYAGLPARTAAPLGLAICLGAQYEEWRARLEPLGWRIREAGEVSATPDDYRRDLQRAKGGVSCVKAYCPQFVNSWRSGEHTAEIQSPM